jgi:hypothetical protein
MAAPKKDMAVVKEYAKLLFTQSNESQKVIAARVGVTEKTIGKWVAEGMWHSYRKSLLTSKKDQLSRLYDILSNVTSSIEETKEGTGSPAMADMMIKYTAAIRNLEIETNTAQIMDAMKMFITWLLNNDAEQARKIIELADAFIQERLKQAQ